MLIAIILVAIFQDLYAGGVKFIFRCRSRWLPGTSHHSSSPCPCTLAMSRSWWQVRTDQDKYYDRRRRPRDREHGQVTAPWWSGMWQVHLFIVSLYCISTQFPIEEQLGMLHQGRRVTDMDTDAWRVEGDRNHNLAPHQTAHQLSYETLTSLSFTIFAFRRKVSHWSSMIRRIPTSIGQACSRTWLC